MDFPALTQVGAIDFFGIWKGNIQSYRNFLLTDVQKMKPE